MKKIIFAIALIFSVAHLFAQDDAVINLYVQQKKYEQAKEQVDKLLADPKLKEKEKPNALLWKMVVYSNLYADSALGGKYPDADKEALDAFKQYQEIDPTLKLMKDQTYFAQGLSNVDNGYVMKGNGFWSDKKYDSAFKYFSQTERLNQILYANKFVPQSGALDTTLVLFIAIAAQNSNQYDSAAAYFSKLADIKVSDPNDKSIYSFLLTYYAQKKDDANFKKYLALAKEVYPGDASTWTQYEMEQMTANASLSDLLQKYQQDAAAGGMTLDKVLGYAQAFESNDSAQLAPLDSAQKVQIKLAAAQAYGKAFELDSSNGLYAFGAGYYYFLVFETLDDRYISYRGAAADLKAKRDQIAKQEMAYADSALPWLEKAFQVLSAKQDRDGHETSNLNRTVDDLAIIYGWKRDRTKIDGNTKDFDKYDALFSKYDALHSSFK